jgi:FkbM family methyltransferase
MAGLRGSIRSTIIRLGREEQARNLQRRLREARSAFDGGLRRNLRDDHAMEVILATVLCRDSNAIDVGANEGVVLAAITRIAPAGRHIAYEPVPELHDDLVRRFPDVDVRQAALFNANGTASFTHVLDAASRSGLRQRSDLDVSPDRLSQISVRTERLDDVLERDYVPTLIKIDVEGAELGVLQGAVETLNRHRPFVLFEHGIGTCSTGRDCGSSTWMARAPTLASTSRRHSPSRSGTSSRRPGRAQVVPGLVSPASGAWPKGLSRAVSEASHTPPPPGFAV